jgi:hypothetical protein
MIGAGSIYADGTDSTARADGKRDGSPWTTIAGQSPMLSESLASVHCPNNPLDVVRIAYEARGRRIGGGSPSILLVGTAVISNSGGAAVIAETVETSTSTRMRLAAPGSPVAYIVCDGDLVNDWEFQVKLAYELPGVAP